jgi:hypothetical protein
VGVTVSAIVVVSVRLPDVAVMGTVTGPPVAAVAPAANVSVLVPAVGLGLNVAVTPFGKSEAVRLTLPLNPFAGVNVILLVPCVRRATLSVLGEAVKLKAGADNWPA